MTAKSTRPGRRAKAGAGPAAKRRPRIQEPSKARVLADESLKPDEVPEVLVWHGLPVGIPIRTAQATQRLYEQMHKWGARQPDPGSNNPDAQELYIQMQIQMGFAAFMQEVGFDLSYQRNFHDNLSDLQNRWRAQASGMNPGTSPLVQSRQLYLAALVEWYHRKCGLGVLNAAKRASVALRKYKVGGEFYGYDGRDMSPERVKGIRRGWAEEGEPRLALARKIEWAEQVEARGNRTGEQALLYMATGGASEATLREEVRQTLARAFAAD